MIKTLIPQSGTVLSSKVCWGQFVGILPIDVSLELIVDLPDTHGASLTSDYLSFAGIPGTLPMTAFAKGGRKRSRLKLTSGMGPITASHLPDVMLKKLENRQSHDCRKLAAEIGHLASVP